MAWYASLFKDSTDEKLKGGLIAVWNGTSGGTKNMIELAQKASLPVFIHKVENFEDDGVDELEQLNKAASKELADAHNGK